jgi:hypothetical protein
MNGEALKRAWSHIRYWQYRRETGSPVPLRWAVRDAWNRFWFERAALRR